MSGSEILDFPAPVGKVEALYTLHSEVAMFPSHFQALREASFKVAFRNLLLQKWISGWTRNGFQRTSDWQSFAAQNATCPGWESKCATRYSTRLRCFGKWQREEKRMGKIFRWLPNLLSCRILNGRLSRRSRHRSSVIDWSADACQQIDYRAWCVVSWSRSTARTFFDELKRRGIHVNFLPQNENRIAFLILIATFCLLGLTAPPKPNVVLITIDTLRADRLDVTDINPHKHQTSTGLLPKESCLWTLFHMCL